jgi:FixJ family two-component response regulator
MIDTNGFPERCSGAIGFPQKPFEEASLLELIGPAMDNCNSYCRNQENVKKENKKRRRQDCRQ